MDVVLKLCDQYALNDLYAQLPAHEFWAQDHVVRQSISTFAVVTIFGWFLYLSFAGLSYYVFFVWKRDVFHPATEKQPFKGQVRKEIGLATSSIPVMSLITVPLFLLEIRGYSMLYDDVEEYGWGYFFGSILCFVMFTDMLIYFIHRALHWPLLYKYIHKPHHEWKVPTPFASHAFHPVDGFLQSVPYHIFVFLFPLHKVLYLCLFAMVNMWTISIHDGVGYVANGIILGADHHDIHHGPDGFHSNYGQYTTLWDRLCGSHVDPQDHKMREIRTKSKSKSVKAH